MPSMKMVGLLAGGSGSTARSLRFFLVLRNSRIPDCLQFTVGFTQANLRQEGSCHFFALSKVLSDICWTCAYLRTR